MKVSATLRIPRTVELHSLTGGRLIDERKRGHTNAAIVPEQIRPRFATGQRPGRSLNTEREVEKVEPSCRRVELECAGDLRLQVVALQLHVRRDTAGIVGRLAAGFSDLLAKRLDRADVALDGRGCVFRRIGRNRRVVGEIGRKRFHSRRLRISERAGALKSDPAERSDQLPGADDLARYLSTDEIANERQIPARDRVIDLRAPAAVELEPARRLEDRKSTRLNSSHLGIS